jgi:pimeloyl-ACP methyl ester carboxylesterase
MIIQVNDTQLNVEDQGIGHTILLIHGSPLNLEMWRPQIDALSADGRVIAIDLRGHGQSPVSPGPYSMDLLADDCAAVLEALQVSEPVTVCGLSMGGYVCFSLYRKYPQIFSGLVLAATRAAADTDQGKENRDQTIAEVSQHGMQPVIDRMLPMLLAPQTYTIKPELVERVSAIMQQTSSEGMISVTLGMKNRPGANPTLGLIEVPVLILHGSEDQIIPISESESMHLHIPNSRLEILPGAGHLLNLEQPEIFNRLVADFMQSI